MGREEDEGVEEDVGPDGGDEQDDAGLGEDSSAWMGVRDMP